MKTILVVDDEKSIRDSIKMILEYDRYEVQFAADGLSALDKIKAGPIDAVLLDIKMAGMDGMKVLKTIKEKLPELPVVMISGHGTIETAVEATKLGAFDFLQKPLDRDRLLITVRNATNARHLMAEVKEMREQAIGKDAILGESPRIKNVLAVVEKVAPTEARVLVLGENGSGKELVARAIHRQSRRSDKPLVEVNCAAIPNELIESELFGHERGAFTGATSQRIGKFELADGGTLLLDEIGDMSMNAQAKVLRAIEEGKIERVGGNKQIAVDVRLIAATNKNLPEMIKAGTFREDLFHRLNVIPIIVPPLRERREDIPLLANAFAADICQRYGMARKTFSEEALQRLKSLDWSGNVRELRNVVERLVIMTPSGAIMPESVELGSENVKSEFTDILDQGGTFQDFKDKAEAAFIKRLLDQHEWNISRTAQALDIQRSHLYNKMKKYGLMRGGEESD
jgi:two-component system, NtrC family, nitrogen regulation response regulator NtrX